MSTSDGIPKSPFHEEDSFGIPQQKTRCKVIVHSHITDNDLKGTIDCYHSVIACDISKTIKGGGGASFTLVPRRNYMNYIFPNDLVNIYFDPGDGRGFIRTFFGFVDRINRAISVNEEGASTTRYQVICSDFTKAFDKTNIYFNPHVADREDFLGNFAGTKNLAGSALRTKGITIYGSPADIVLNLSHLLLGFGAQFKLPLSYPINNAIMAASRTFRQKWVLMRLPEDITEGMFAAGKGTVTEFVDYLKEEAKGWVPTLKTDKSALAKALVDTGEFNPAANEGPIRPEDRAALIIEENSEEFIGPPRSGPTDFQKLALKYASVLKAKDPNVLSNSEVKAALQVEKTFSKQGTLLDLIDFSFVEYGAIDGSIVSAPIWTQQGTLWSIMNSFSNGVINELFCDLRPMGARQSEFGLTKGGYSSDPDELHTVPSDSDETTPVRFVPALIMREYPFGTIKSIDGYEATILQQEVGRVRVGEIWAIEPNVPGRKIVELVPPLNDYQISVSTDKSGEKSAGIKHLDVSVISVRDIITESVGRSDNDTVNLIELYTDGVFGSHMKYLAQDFQPIVIPISVMRHGLRVRTYSTKFARFSKKRQAFAGIDNVGTRRKLARWVLMLDHWYQHNAEYLNGTISTRAFPEIRVGTRLDIYERRESYYVEGVNHTWQYPEPLLSTFTVSRGQRNDPYPVYEKPALKAFGGLRTDVGRLSQYFRQIDPSATLKAVTGIDSNFFEEFYEDRDSNMTDFPSANTWGKSISFVASGGDDLKLKFSAEKNELAADIALQETVKTGELANPVAVTSKADKIISEAITRYNPGNPNQQNVSKLISTVFKDSQSGTTSGGRGV